MHPAPISPEQLASFGFGNQYNLEQGVAYISVLATIQGKVMITSVEEFIKLRTGDKKEDQDRASLDSANNAVWLDIVQNHPEYRVWVVHNKTIPVDILELLAEDENAAVRAAVARKRKINDKIFNLLSVDKDENVRYALICNTKLQKEKKRLIQTDGSQWLKSTLDEQLAKAD